LEDLPQYRIAARLFNLAYPRHGSFLRDVTANEDSQTADGRRRPNPAFRSDQSEPQDGSQDQGSGSAALSLYSTSKASRGVSSSGRMSFSIVSAADSFAAAGAGRWWTARNSGRSSASRASAPASSPFSRMSSTSSARAVTAGGNPASLATWMP